MKKKIYFRKISFYCVLLIIPFLFGCNKHKLSDISKKIGFDQNVAVPIGYGEFDVHDLLNKNDSLVSLGDLGILELVYEDNLDTITAADVLQLSDFSETFDMLPPNFNLAVTPSFTGTITNSDVRNSDYVTSNGVELHTLNFLSGSLTMSLSTTIQHDITLVITMLDLQSNSTPIVRTINSSYTGSLPQTATNVIDLTDVLADFTAGGSSVNRLRVSVDATITGTGQPILGTENLDLTMMMSSLQFKNITGYFGQDVLSSVSDSILMKIFNNPQVGNIAFTNPDLLFTIDNSFGIPIDLNFSNFSSVQTVAPFTETPLTLGSSVATTSLGIPPVMGQNALTTIDLNVSNTQNLSSLIESSPKYLKYSVSATSNPAGNVAPLNFIENTSRMIIKAKLTLPFQGYASDFQVEDTMKLNGASYGKNVDHIKSIMLRLNVNNGFPISFKGNLHFMDSLNAEVFTVFPTGQEQQFVTAASVDGSGVVSSPTSATTDFVLTETQVALLNKVRKVIIRGTAESTQPLNTEVKIYDSYKIALKLGIQVQAK